MKPEAEEWLRIADADLAGAEVLLNAGLLAPAAFHCQQAAEKTLKALWVERNASGYPPKTHDLPELVQAAGLQLPEWTAYIAHLSDEAIRSRYSDSSAYTAELVASYVDRTKQLCAALRQHLS